MSGTANGFNHESQGHGRIVFLTAGICVVLVIVLLILLRLFAHYILWRQQGQSQTQQAQSQPATTNVPAPVVGHQVRRFKTGLDPVTVALLPKFAYRKNKPEGDTDGAPEKCSVCLSQLEEGETVRLLPTCRHSFHLNCIDMWLYSHNSCPLCRKVVGPFLVSPHLQ